jgi:hypothetical protein
MKLDKDLDLSGIVSKDKFRIQLNNPYLTAAGELVATNGHIMAIVPWVMTPGKTQADDTEGWVTIEALKAAKGEYIQANGSLNVIKKGIKFERPAKDERRFPDWAKTRDGAVAKVKPVVTLNADYIMALAKAIAAKGPNGRNVTLWADPENMVDGAWMVTPGPSGNAEAPNLHEPHGLIMPVRR